MWRKSNLPFLKEVCFHFQLPWSHFWISMTIDISGTSQLYKVTSKSRAVHCKQHTTPFKWILSSFVAQTMASSMCLKSFRSKLENTHVNWDKLLIVFSPWSLAELQILAPHEL
jgi:hypothetical protein